MVERTLPPTSNNRKQGKRLGTKPRTVQTGGVGASYRCVFWIRLDLWSWFWWNLQPPTTACL